MDVKIIQESLDNLPAHGQIRIHTRKATGAELLLMHEAQQEGDDAGIAKLFGGIFDPEGGEGAHLAAVFVNDAADAILRLHGDGEFMEEIDADAQPLRHTFNGVDVMRGGHDQAAAARMAGVFFQCQGNS